MPLLDQYLRNGEGALDMRVYGVSAQGGKLTMKGEEPSEDRERLLSRPRRTHRAHGEATNVERPTLDLPAIMLTDNGAIKRGVWSAEIRGEDAASGADRRSSAGTADAALHGKAIQDRYNCVRVGSQRRELRHAATLQSQDRHGAEICDTVRLGSANDSNNLKDMRGLRNDRCLLFAYYQISAAEKYF
jgi:hypothetical protein